MKEIQLFKDLPIKDKISYYVAIAMISSGILLAFLSFFLNAYNIATGVLIYIAQCFVIGGGLVGANVYFKSKWLEFDTNAKREIQSQIDEAVKKALDENYESTVEEVLPDAIDEALTSKEYLDEKEKARSGGKKLR